MKKHITITISMIAMLLGLATGLGIYSAKYYQQGSPENPDIKGLLWPNPKQISTFSTIDQNNEEFGLQQLLGKWSFVFFGYTHCPDVCPISMSVMNQVHQHLATKSKDNNVQTLFVTVDPERDTPDQLKTYVRYFNQEFIGIGGTEQQIKSLGDQIGIVYIHGDKSNSTGYIVDHTSSIFLIDPKGRLVGIFSAPQETFDIVSRFLAMQSYIDSHG